MNAFLSRAVRSVVIGSAVCSTCGFVYAQAPQTTQSTAVAPQGLEATITGLEGKVQVRQNDDQPWTKAVVGMKLGQMAEIRTGVGSSVRCTIPPDQTFTLDRLGTVKLLEALRDGNLISTELMMEYGRVRLDVESAGVEHRSSISSPSSTLAVRGTRVSLYDQRPFITEAVSLTGRAEFRDGKKQISVGARNQGKTKVNSESANSAELAITESTQDPSISLARTDNEANLVDNLLSKGSTIFFDRDAGIKVVRGGTPPNDASLIPTLPGVLNFVARWDTDADINFSVATPGGKNNAGEVLYPTGALATNSSGGKVAFDHRGGKKGGIEVIYFPKGAPIGLYGLGLTLISGEPTTARVDAFLNGKRIGIFDGQNTVTTAVTDVTRPIPGFVDGNAVGVVPIGVDIPGGGNRPSVLKRSAPMKRTNIATVTPAIKRERKR